MEDIILLGTGGHAHSIVDSIEACKEYHIVGFLDTEDKVGMKYKDYSVLGTDEMLEYYYKQGVGHAFVSVGYMGKSTIRNRLYQYIKQCGYNVPNIIDKTAVLASDISIGEGNFIGKRAIINSSSSVGNMCIINTASIIEHDCVINDFSHVAVASVLCGSVVIGRETLIGANATVIQGRVIGNRCIIGAGATVKKNVEDDGVVI